VLTLEISHAAVTVRADGRERVTYRRDGAYYPHFFPVRGPHSESLTTESSEPYPHHHSLWLGHGNVDGEDWWQCDRLPPGRRSGRIVPGEGRVLAAAGERVGYEHPSRWVRPDGRVALCERRRWWVEATADGGWLLDFAIALAADPPVTLGKTNHAFFAARVPPERSVRAGGCLRNAAGEQGEAGTFGRPAPWCDYSGPDGAGLAIFDHPANPWYPSPWFTRDYGFFSPTPFHWLTEPLRLGAEPLRCVYRVWVHGLVTPDDLATMATAFAASGWPAADLTP